MMYWKYLALNRIGKEIVGQGTGTKQEVYDLLKKQGLQVVTVSIDYARLSQNVFKKKKIPSKVLADFFEDFEILISTDLGIIEAIYSLQETSMNKVLKEVLGNIKTQLIGGRSLTDSFRETKIFPPIVINSLNAGERGGRLKEVLVTLSKYFKRQDEIKSLIIKSTWYPSLVLVMLFAIMFYVSFKVIPQFSELLPDGAMDSWHTQVVLFVSSFIRKWWVLVGGFFVSLIIVLARLKQMYSEKFTEYFYKVPLIGELAKESALSLYFLNLSVLNFSGIPLLEAFNSLDSNSNGYVYKKFLACRDWCIGGACFWQALEKEKFFPSVVSFSLKKGEQTGNIGKYLFKISEYFSRRVKKRVDIVLSLIQPLFLIFCGGIMIITALAILRPIYSNLNSIAIGG